MPAMCRRARVSSRPPADWPTRAAARILGPSPFQRIPVAQWADRLKSRLYQRPLLLFVVLYVVVGAIGSFAETVMPAQLHLAVEARTSGAGLGSFSGLGREARTLPLPAAPLWSVSMVAMLAAA